MSTKQDVNRRLREATDALAYKSRLIKAAEEQRDEARREAGKLGTEVGRLRAELSEANAEAGTVEVELAQALGAKGVAERDAATAQAATVQIQRRNNELEEQEIDAKKLRDRLRKRSLEMDEISDKLVKTRSELAQTKERFGKSFSVLEAELKDKLAAAAKSIVERNKLLGLVFSGLMWVSNRPEFKEGTPGYEAWKKNIMPIIEQMKPMLRPKDDDKAAAKPAAESPEGQQAAAG